MVAICDRSAQAVSDLRKKYKVRDSAS